MVNTDDKYNLLHWNLVSTQKDAPDIALKKKKTKQNEWMHTHLDMKGIKC